MYRPSLDGTHQITDPAPFCEGRLVPLTVVHILTECPEYSNQRRRAFGADGIRSAIVPTDKIKDDSSHVEFLLLFLRECSLMHSL